MSSSRCHLGEHSASTIITPHPGEAGRVLGSDSAHVEGDRPAAVRGLVAKLGGVAVLKGARTLVAGSNALWACHEGGPELATAGSGDVLAGVIGALVGRGLSPMDAARVGVAIHGRAGHEAAEANGVVLASDLPLAVARLLG